MVAALAFKAATANILLKATLNPKPTSLETVVATVRRALFN